jgi:hypothetical protein
LQTPPHLLPYFCMKNASQIRRAATQGRSSSRQALELRPELPTAGKCRTSNRESATGKSRNYFKISDIHISNREYIAAFQSASLPAPALGRSL